MAVVYIRGRAMTWFYLCDNCHKKTFKTDPVPRSNCSVCQQRVKLPEGFVVCNACSHELQMCMACGCHTQVGDSVEEVIRKSKMSNISKKKRRRKRRV